MLSLGLEGLGFIMGQHTLRANAVTAGARVAMSWTHPFLWMSFGAVSQSPHWLYHCSSSGNSTLAVQAQGFGAHIQ